MLGIAAGIFCAAMAYNLLTSQVRQLDGTLCGDVYRYFPGPGERVNHGENSTEQRLSTNALCRAAAKPAGIRGLTWLAAAGALAGPATIVLRRIRAETPERENARRVLY